MVKLDVRDRKFGTGRQATLGLVIVSKVDAVLFDQLRRLFGADSSVPTYVDIVARIASDD